MLNIEKAIVILSKGLEGRNDMTANNHTTDSGINAQLQATLAEHPVVMLVAEENEFSQAVSILFRILSVPYYQVQADFAPEKSEDQSMFPQIFVGARCMGGSIELFERYMEGDLLRRLNEVGIELERRWTFDPASMLQQWLISRKTDLKDTG